MDIGIRDSNVQIINNRRNQDKERLIVAERVSKTGGSSRIQFSTLVVSDGSSVTALARAFDVTGDHFPSLNTCAPK